LNSIEKNKQLGFVYNESSTVQVGYEQYYGGYYGRKKSNGDEDSQNGNMGSA
jgi:hypothetical protein